MSLYALTAAGLTRIRRAFYGTPIPTELKADEQGNINQVEGGSTTDPGLQTFVNDLIAGFSSQDPIALPEPLQFIQPANSPAIIIKQQINPVNVDGGGNTILQFITNNNTTVINFNEDGSITKTVYETVPFQTSSPPGVPSITNINNTVNNETVVLMDSTPGFSGQVTYWTGASVSVVGCNATITPTTSTLTITNGKITGVS